MTTAAAPTRTTAQDAAARFDAWERERYADRRAIGLGPRDHDAREIVDGDAAVLEALRLPGAPALDEVRQSNVDLIERMMVVARGYPPIVNPLWRLIREISRREGRAVRVLDIGAGQGAILERLHKRARRSGVDVALAAADLNPGYVRTANERFRRRSLPIEVVVADATRMPEFEEDRFDIAMHTLLLHHLDPEAVAASLLEMDRVARYGAYIFDLDRNALAYAGMWLSTSLVPHRYRRAFVSDATTSVRRSYTPEEVRWFLRELGFGDRYRVRRPMRPPWLGHAWLLTPVA